MTQRQEGYYWVKIINWHIAYWDYKWYLTGSEDGYTDICFDEIDEHRIPTPDEKKGSD